MQKRGIVCIGEDFTQLTGTYPTHPLTLNPRRHQSQSDMQQKKKDGASDDMIKEGVLWDKANPYWIDRVYVKPEGYVETPLYTSVNQARKADRQKQREEWGLTCKPVFLTDSSKDPNLKFIVRPEYNCKSELNLSRKKQTLKDAKTIEANIDSFKDMKTRYLEREEFNIAACMDGALTGQNRSRENSLEKESGVRTRTQLKVNRKDESV